MILKTPKNKNLLATRLKKTGLHSTAQTGSVPITHRDIKKTRHSNKGAKVEIYL